MDIQRTLFRISQKLSEERRQANAFRLGLGTRPKNSDRAKTVRDQFIQPLCRKLSGQTGLEVSFASGVSPLFFWLLVKGRRFAIASVPNPETGRAFIQYLNVKGHPCTSTQPLVSTEPIRQYILNF